MMVDGAQKVIIVQTTVWLSHNASIMKEPLNLLGESRHRGQVRHPSRRWTNVVAMNVLLAEANVPYEQLIEMDEIILSSLSATLPLSLVQTTPATQPHAQGKAPWPVCQSSMPTKPEPWSSSSVRCRLVMLALTIPVLHGQTMMLFGDGKAMMTGLNNAIKEI